MKKARLILLGLLIASLLMNLPATYWPSIGGNTSSAKAASFVPENAEIFGNIFSDGFESGDVSSWSVNEPGNLAGRKSANGLQQGEKITGMDSLAPSSSQLITINNENDDKVIGVSNLGGVYEIKCETGDAVLMNSIFSDLTNPLDPTIPNNKVGFSINRSTGFMAFSNTELGNKIVGINLSSGQTFVGNNLFFPQNDPNQGKMPKVNGLLFPDGFEDANPFGIDSNNDVLTSINAQTGETKTIGPLGVDISCLSEIDVAPKNDSSEPDRAFMSAVLEGEIFSRFYSLNLQTGQATEIGIIGDGTEKIQSFTIVKPLQQSAATCDINPSSVKKRVGTQHTFDVTVFLNGQPVSGANVGINVTTGPNQNLTGTAGTNQNGQATFAYMSNNLLGLDTIQVSGAVEGNPFSCTATVEWTSLLIESVADRTGNKSNNITLTGLFQRNDGVEINGQMASKIKYKKCDSNNNCDKIVVKKGVTLLNQCPNGTPVTNEVRVFRPNSTAPAITDTAAFATCP